MFFNKEKVLLNPRADTDLQLNTETIIPFYISEVISNTTIDSVLVQPFTKELKTQTLLSNFVEIDTNANGEYEVTYKPTTIGKDNLFFRFKVICGQNEHLVDSCAFSVHTIGVP
jgi:hypothetical protein